MSVQPTTCTKLIIMSSSSQVLCNSLLYSHRVASQRSALPSCDDLQHMVQSDVKLFGKSILSQPNLMASAVPSLLASSNGNVTLQQPAFSNISTPAASIGTRGALSKVYEMDSVALPSAFGRVGGPYVVSEGRQAVWPTHTTVQPGDLGFWKRVSTL